MMDGRPRWDAHLPDPRPPKRVKATADQWVQLRAEKLDGQPCRVFPDKRADSLHHLVPRSQGGDDVADNLVGLSGTGTTEAHGLVEARDPWACSLLGQRLTSAERAYVVAKRGAWFLETRYGVKEAA
jgi:hypothetical protein